MWHKNENTIQAKNISHWYMLRGNMHNLHFMHNIFILFWSAPHFYSNRWCFNTVLDLLPLHRLHILKRVWLLHMSHTYRWNKLNHLCLINQYQNGIIKVGEVHISHACLAFHNCEPHNNTGLTKICIIQTLWARVWTKRISVHTCVFQFEYFFRRPARAGWNCD